MDFQTNKRACSVPPGDQRHWCVGKVWSSRLRLMFNAHKKTLKDVHHVQLCVSHEVPHCYGNTCLCRRRRHYYQAMKPLLFRTACAKAYPRWSDGDVFVSGLCAEHSVLTMQTFTGEGLTGVVLFRMLQLTAD